jgi:hypothetical protein
LFSEVLVVCKPSNGGDAGKDQDWSRGFPRDTREKNILKTEGQLSRVKAMVPEDFSGKL